ncbi:hypothetical protein IJJ53_03425 [Candidatus Saccharibacteria bacterium]|nr:hypothetical protein [Candidatus Saccharibacteria bacterium]
MAKTLQNVSWEATEYIERDHNTWWYIGLFAVGIGLCVLSFFLQWWSFIALVIVCIIAILVTSLRPPRKIQYSLDQNGLTEGGKLYKYEDFRAFGILKEGSHFSAVLIPKKRFAIQAKVYFPGDSGEAIVDALGARLPMEEVKLDFLDKIVNFLRI